MTEALLFSAFAGILGTAAGGLAALLLRARAASFTRAAMAFAGGVMLAVSFLDLIPAAAALAPFYLILPGVVAGVLIVALLGRLLPEKGTGALLFLAIALHNFPEGLAIGTGLTAAPRLGFTLALLIALHNLPEGLSVALALRKDGAKPLPVLLLTALCGAPTVLGGFSGMLIGRISPAVTAFSLAAAAGAMIEVTFAEVLPESLPAPTRLPSFAAVGGCLFGFLTAALLS